jgi:hypothetical protein
VQNALSMAKIIGCYMHWTPDVVGNLIVNDKASTSGLQFWFESIIEFEKSKK